MEMIFEKIPLKDYISFFETNDEDKETLRWIEIQYEYIKEPSWSSFNTFEIYCPTNISVTKGAHFSIPTGFKCISDCNKVTCLPCFEISNETDINRETVSKHIVLSGTAEENRCFQAGDRLLKLKFGG